MKLKPLCIFILGIIFVFLFLSWEDLVPMLDELNELKEKIHTFEKITASTVFLETNSAKRFYTSTEKLQLLLAIAKRNNLIIKNMQDFRGGLQFILEGEFFNIKHFLDFLNDANMVMIQDFSIKQTDDNLLLILLVNMNPIYPNLNLVGPNKSLTKIYNPFCNARCNDIHNLNTDANVYSIKNMRMIGYLSKKGLSRALILLPNEKIIIVNIGDEMGIEHLKIEHIKPNSIALLSKSQKYVFLHLTFHTSLDYANS
jgi:hypothetical protein